MSPRLLHAVLWPALAAWLVFLAWSGREVGFLADDYEFLKIAAEMQSPLQAFERGHTSPKPLHHLIFWWGAHCTGPDANWMRLPAFLAHALALGFVFRIGRQAGASPVGAALATLLYASFATTRSLLWPVAISGFLRVTCALAALSFWIDAVRSYRTVSADGVSSHWARSTCAAIVATLFAMGAHQSGALTPGFFVLWAMLVGGERGIRESALRGLRAAFHPAVLGSVVVVGAYVVWASGTTDQYRGIRELGAIAANTLRSVVALAPQELRICATEAARGKLLGAASVAGWLVIAGYGTFYGWRLVRGSGLWRFAIVAGSIDIALAVVTAGWSQRYCYFAAALFAIALGVSWSCVVLRWQRVMIGAAAVLLAACWARESLRVGRELQEASAVARDILDAGQRADQELGTGNPLVIANAPDVWGTEQDLPLFNWGLEPALRTRGVTRAIRQVRTTPARTSTAASLVTPAAVQELRGLPEGGLLEFDPATRRLARWRAGKPVLEGR